MADDGVPPRHALNADGEDNGDDAGNPSGTAATARATPRMSAAKIAEKPRASSTNIIVAIIATR